MLCGWRYIDSALSLEFVSQNYSIISKKKGSECASSGFILHEVLVGDGLEVKAVSHVLVVVQDHQMV